MDTADYLDTLHEALGSLLSVAEEVREIPGPLAKGRAMESLTDTMAFLIEWMERLRLDKPDSWGHNPNVGDPKGFG
jgi:hypothetical protein